VRLSPRQWGVFWRRAYWEDCRKLLTGRLPIRCWCRRIGRAVRSTALFVKRGKPSTGRRTGADRRTKAPSIRHTPGRPLKPRAFRRLPSRPISGRGLDERLSRASAPHWRACRRFARRPFATQRMAFRREHWARENGIQSHGWVVDRRPFTAVRVYARRISTLGVMR